MQRGTFSESMRRYSVALPNRLLYSTLSSIGTVILWWTPVLAMLVLIIKTFHVESAFERLGWNLPESYMGFLLVYLAGIVLRLGPGRIYRRYYEHVYQGKVVNMTVVGNNRHQVLLLEIRGYTYANVMKRDTHEVSVKEWHDVRPGDIIQLPEPIKSSR